MEKDIKNYFTSSSSKIEDPTLVVNKFEKQSIDKIPGATLVKNFLSETEEKNLLQVINKMPWQNSLKRRVQHYGYKYDYNARSTTEYLGKLPDFMDFVIQRMTKEKIIEEVPDQCIINEYDPGQGISPHTDKTAFGNEIVSISLGSDIIMDFYDSDNHIAPVQLPRRSLLLIQDDARYKWKHGIANRKKDKLSNGLILHRKKRVPLTFRTVKKEK